MKTEEILSAVQAKIEFAKSLEEQGHRAASRCQIASLHVFLINEICPGEPSKPEPEGGTT